MVKEYANKKANNPISTGIAKLDDYIKRLKAGEEITEINLQGLKIGDKEVIALATVLETNTSLKTLNLRDSNIGNKGVAALDKALKINTTLQNIYLPDKQLSALNESLFFNRSIPKKIEKITNAKIIEAKISVSDAAILTEDILDIVKELDKRITKGKEEEEFLKEKDLYDKYFDERDLPRSKPGEDVDLSLVDQDLFNYTVQKSLSKKSANKRDEKESESDLDSDDPELEAGTNDLPKPNPRAQRPTSLKLQDSCREGSR